MNIDMLVAEVEKEAAEKNVNVDLDAARTVIASMAGGLPKNVRLNFGSGYFVVTDDGHIVTNNTVVNDGKETIHCSSCRKMTDEIENDAKVIIATNAAIVP